MNLSAVMIRLPAWFVPALVAWATTASAQTGTPLSLSDAIARAKATHPDAAFSMVYDVVADQATR